MASTTTTRADLGGIRAYYDRMRLIVPGMKARQDIVALLEDRRAVAQAADKLLAAAAPYSGDANVKAAIDEVRAALHGTA